MAASTLWRAGLLGLLAISSRARAETPEGPYDGIAATVPGVIEAEEFDYGGEGVGYSDSTFVNIQQDFRLNESVDINAMSGGGYNVGKITAGEYLRYTVNVTEDVDSFYFNFVVSSNETTGSFRIVSGGDGCDDYDTDLSGVVTVPNTGGWEEFEDFAVSGEDGAGLDAGEAYIWFCALTENFNIDCFTMTTSPAPEGAYRGDPAVVPGLIEAEEFDYGGEGVGYSDSTVVNIQQEFRLDEAVDVNAMGEDRYNVGKITVGEYLRYTVVVKEDVDAFFFNFVVSSNETTGSFRIVSGGAGCHDYTTDLSGVVMVPDTGGWEDFEDVAASGEGNGGLVAGSTYIWFCALTENFNIDSFTMTTSPAQEGAYGGVPATVPGLIEAEEFDYGGEGVGYSDSTIVNVQQDFRLDEAVDINTLEGGGYNVGKITAGEYLRYTVDVTADVDSFYFNFVVSSNETTGSFRIVSGGTGCDDYTTDLSGAVMVPNTGGWEDFDNLSVPGEEDGGLEPGLTYIWFCALTENFNIDSFTMTTSPAPEGAFGGVPATVPGRIEAEEFDTGGEGVGYSDSTADNIPQEFRPDEAVDINALAGGGYNVGNITAGEYLRYTVDVMANVDEFYFSFVVSSKQDTGSFHIVSGGTGCDDFTTDLSGIVMVPNTGWLQQYEEVAVSGGGKGGLDAGTAYIWLCVLSETFNIDSFTIDMMPSIPFGGTPATVPGLIEAEEYDIGGQGVAYDDMTTGNDGNAFRTDESVDVGSIDDGGFFVGWVKEGEFLHYTVDVLEDVDTFIFSFLVSAPSSSPGSLRIVTGGTDCDDFTTDLSGLVTVPGEGGSIYNEVITYNEGTGGLSAGVSVIRLCVVTEFFNIDSFSMVDPTDR